MKLFVLISHEFKHTVVLLYSYHSDVLGSLDLNVVLGVFSNSFLVISFTMIQCRNFILGTQIRFHWLMLWRLNG